MLNNELMHNPHEGKRFIEFIFDIYREKFKWDVKWEGECECDASK